MKTSEMCFQALTSSRYKCYCQHFVPCSISTMLNCGVLSFCPTLFHPFSFLYFSSSPHVLIYSPCVPNTFVYSVLLEVLPALDWFWLLQSLVYFRWIAQSGHVTWGPAFFTSDQGCIYSPPTCGSLSSSDLLPSFNMISLKIDDHDYLKSEPSKTQLSSGYLLLEWMLRCTTPRMHLSCPCFLGSKIWTFIQWSEKSTMDLSISWLLLLLRMDFTNGSGEIKG